MFCSLCLCLSAGLTRWILYHFKRLIGLGDCKPFQPVANHPFSKVTNVQDATRTLPCKHPNAYFISQGARQETYMERNPVDVRSNPLLNLLDILSSSTLHSPRCVALSGLTVVAFLHATHHSTTILLFGVAAVDEMKCLFPEPVSSQGSYSCVVSSCILGWLHGRLQPLLRL